MNLGHHTEIGFSNHICPLAPLSAPWRSGEDGLRGEFLPPLSSTSVPCICRVGARGLFWDECVSASSRSQKLRAPSSLDLIPKLGERGEGVTSSVGNHRGAEWLREAGSPALGPRAVGWGCCTAMQRQEGVSSHASWGPRKQYDRQRQNIFEQP